MTDLERFVERRANILAAVTAAGITQTSTNRNWVPDDRSAGWKAGVVSLANDDLGKETAVRNLRHKLQFEVYFIVDGDVADPDLELFTLIELFRASYQASERDDVTEVKYYDSRAGAQPCRIARALTARRYI